jgi:hypothetical protein
VSGALRSDVTHQSPPGRRDRARLVPVAPQGVGKLRSHAHPASGGDVAAAPDRAAASPRPLRHLRSIDPALLRRYHDNDPELVAEALLAAPLRRRDRLTVDWEGAWVLDADPIPRSPGRPVTIHVELTAPVPVRPLRLVATGLGISRAAAERLRADGRIRSSTSLDARTSGSFRVTVALADEPADGRNSRLRRAER